jgi:hypothetical protein
MIVKSIKIDNIKINIVIFIIKPTIIILLSSYSRRAKSGPWSKKGLADGYGKLADQTLYGCLGPVRPCKIRYRQLGFVSCLVRVS